MKIVSLILLILLSVPTLGAPSEDQRINHFAAQYRAEKSPEKKRALCMKAMDDNLIHIGMNIKAIDRMFGTRLAFDQSVTDTNRAAINFSPQLKVRGDVPIQVPFVGWYLALEWSRSGEVLDYYISNIHK